MNSLRTRRTAMAVAAAFLMPTIAITSAAAQTTEIGVIDYLLTDVIMSHLKGSVISADSTATTVEVDCRSEFTHLCTSSIYILPQTFTSGPSIQGISFDVTSYIASTILIASARAKCDITSTSLGASCVRATSLWYSSGSSSNSSRVSGPVTLSPTLTYKTLAVVSGLEKLRTTSTAGSNASPGATATTTSAPTATATSTTPTSEKYTSSSSKAWIAGPVIGVVAGVALAAALAFWLIQRRRKSNADAGGIPSQGLPADHQPLELPANITPAELPGHKNDGKAELPARNLPHELA
ncbi:hypothetical protein N7486_000477 [Penicillium sp. IBT 16267x]|nr:hypothetical protein N7486_000477 [Penicillium sp. IBT 16267x]